MSEKNFTELNQLGELPSAYQKLERMLTNLTPDSYKILVERYQNSNLEQLSEEWDMPIEEMPYTLLRLLLPDGSDDASVANVLRAKREEYLIINPDQKISPDASKGVIAYDGRFIPWQQYLEMTPAQRFEVTVGPTCFHYNTNVPGYGE